jgi:hypothetical protein
VLLTRATAHYRRAAVAPPVALPVQPVVPAPITVPVAVPVAVRPAPVRVLAHSGA